jgi:hypothetical protein
MHILRAGRAAYDRMLANELSVDDFCFSQPSGAQIQKLDEAARIAHGPLRLTIQHTTDTNPDLVVERLVSPAALQLIYRRARTGIVRAIANFSLTAIGLPDEMSGNFQDEQRFLCKQLLQKQHRPIAELLQTVWQTADAALTGRSVAATTERLHCSLRGILPSHDRGERRARIALAVRAARPALGDILVPSLESLKSVAVETTGSAVKGVDVIDSFPLQVLYEGCEEYTDEQIEAMRTERPSLNRRGTTLHLGNL